VVLLYHGPLVQNIMVVYGMMCGIAVSWSSCTEHNGSVWYGLCYCCIMVVLYRTSWLCMIWSVLWLYHGPLVQNIMVVYGMECVIAVSWSSCTEHNGSVWYGVCYCCIMALFYRT